MIPTILTMLLGILSSLLVLLIHGALTMTMLDNIKCICELLDDAASTTTTMQCITLWAKIV